MSKYCVPSMSYFEERKCDRINFCLSCNDKLDSCKCIWAAIRDLQEKVRNHLDLNYEELAKRLIKLEEIKSAKKQYKCPFCYG